MCLQGMVCALEEGSAFCSVRDSNAPRPSEVTFCMPATSTVSDLFQEVGRRMEYHHDSFELLLQGKKEEDPVSNAEACADGRLSVAVGARPGHRRY